MSKKKKQKNVKKPYLPPEMRNKYENKEIRVLSDLPVEAKISAKFLELMEPWIEEIDLSILADCTAIAWNSAINEKFGTKHGAVLNNMLMNFNNYQSIISELKMRKGILYPNDTRIVERAYFNTEKHDNKLYIASKIDYEIMLKNLRMMSEDIDDELLEQDEDYDDGDAEDAAVGDSGAAGELK